MLWHPGGLLRLWEKQLILAKSWRGVETTSKGLLARSWQQEGMPQEPCPVQQSSSKEAGLTSSAEHHVKNETRQNRVVLQC